MQEQVNEKTVALYIKTGKLTAEMLQRAMKKLLSQMKKQADRPPHGKGGTDWRREIGKDRSRPYQKGNEENR